VLRLFDVAISEEALVDKLGVGLDRFSPQRSGDLSWAQINSPESDDVWPTIAGWIATLGSSIAGLITAGAIGGATLDLAFGFASNLVTRSARVPSSIAEAVGRSGIDLEISTYPLDDFSATPPHRLDKG
jgi:hypothetical protein